MKATRKKIMQVIAGIIAFSLIGFILYMANGFVGNPVSAAIAKTAIKQYMETQYPEMEYEFATKVGYNFKDGSYIGRVQSLTSEDTRFYVEYHGKNDIKDDFNFNVLGYHQTMDRLSKEYGNVLQKELSEQIGIPVRRVFVMYQYDKVSDYENLLSLDMKLDPRLPIPLHINISVDTAEADLEQASEWIKQSHEWAKAQGYPIKQYGMDVEFGNKLLSIYGVRATQIDSGELLPLLKKAKENREYDSVIVTVKGDEKG
ncbi:hypothetical protein D3P09_27085 [Paenibacillus pinisoli]|uniref:DUF3139 domain-containing protein n=1 Tax=Paenibacillus pinisoli TaxID=1276110 RepID=A0A3A6PF15_9BACL|nr:hypothetical protein [Paenibacillus pinisoli]RJX36599.1 hypothetical protein D3P09_27085 [Paenibacillus pinisoli]